MNTKLEESLIPSQEDFTGPRFLIGVRVENILKSQLYDPGKLNIRVGNQVMVETDNGIQMGIVASNKIPNIKKKSGKVQRVLRVANENDSQAKARKDKGKQSPESGK